MLSENVFEILGLDSDDLDWQDLSICVGQPIGLFYEEYESSARKAAIVDEMCLSCPVRNLCLQAGVENKEWGVWGGVFLISGKPDIARNAHKTKEVWDTIREGLS